MAVAGHRCFQLTLPRRGTVTGASQTWEWDGSDWSQVVTANNPGYRMYHAMAYDPLRLRTVLFGGWGGDMKGDTWEFSGGECLGDLDGDGDVDLADLAQLLAHYGMTSGAEYEDGDLDGDGDVDLADLAALLANYGTTCE